ncbi:MAG: hypothetical protein ACTSQI_08920 [Candidatus Helarchaeota archaeon]
MLKIDIVGDFQEEIDESIEENFELFLIDKITRPEEFQEILIVYPPPKKKLRWKPYTEEDADVLLQYVDQGGILVLIPPFNSLYREKTDIIYDKFKVSPVFCKKNLLAHINPHLINSGKIGKIPVKAYVHFLFENSNSTEVLIEGNFMPIFALQFRGKGAVILYGLGSKKFWEEDLLLLFKYLTGDYAYFWDKTELTEKQLENVLKSTRTENHDKIREEFIKAFVRKKPFRDFIEIKDPSLRDDLLEKIQLATIEEEYRDLSGKFIVKKYREHFKLLKNDFPKLVKKLQKFLYSKIIDNTINEKSFNLLYESDFLPPEAAYLLIFYLDPKDPENYKKYKENLSKLIHWNKTEKIFDEDFLKQLAWEHL